jgi:hypothetical protein
VFPVGFVHSQYLLNLSLQTRVPTGSRAHNLCQFHTADLPITTLRVLTPQQALDTKQKYLLLLDAVASRVFYVGIGYNKIVMVSHSLNSIPTSSSLETTTITQRSFVRRLMRLPGSVYFLWNIREESPSQQCLQHGRGGNRVAESK